MDLPDSDDRLNSWKEIAAFLGRTVRTVQRWEKTDGLPLRRGGPGQRGAVVASKQDLAAWWARREAAAAVAGKPSWPLVSRRWFWLPVGGAGLVLAVLAAPPFKSDPATPTNPAGQGRLLAASTSEGAGVLSIPLPSEPSGIALAPNGSTAYVALPALGQVAVVDLRERRVVDRLDVVEGAESLALLPGASRLVVAGTAATGVVDLDDHSVRRYVTGHRAHSLHASADGRFVWLPLLRDGLKVLDLETGRLDSIPTVGCPAQVAAASRTGRVFVSYQCGGPGGRDGHDAIEVFDERSRASLVARAGPPLVGSSLAVSPDEQHLWADTHDACMVTNYDQQGCPPGRGPVLHALSSLTLERLLTVRIPHTDTDAIPAFFPDGSRLAVVADGLFVLDRETGTVVEAEPGFPAGHAAFTPAGDRLVVAARLPRSVIVLPLTSAADEGALAGLGVHWTGDGTANDAVSGTHAIAGVPRFVPGRLGRAFAFERADKPLEFGRRLDVDIGSSRATYAAWLHPAPSGGPLTIASRTTDSGWRWWLTADRRPAFCLASTPSPVACAGGGLVAEGPLVSEAWSHVAIARSDDDLTIFVDGQPVASTPMAGFPRLPSPPLDALLLRFGADETGRSGFVGFIDELVMIRRALTGEEIRRVMSATSLDAR